MAQRWITFTAGLLTGLFVTGLLLLLLTPRQRFPIELVPAPTPGPVQVHVAGAVQRPGVYPLQPPATGIDAINAAGGALPRADLDRVNLAAQIEDGQRMYVPFASTQASGEPAALPAADIDPMLQVNINTASLADLERLPGIGPSLAQKIIEHREANGLFTRVEELLDVSGIGPAKFEQLRNLVRVD